MTTALKETKRCPRCETVKERAQFSKNASRSDGLQAFCKTCWNAAYCVPEENRARARAWASKNPARMRARADRWAQSHPERTKQIRKQSAHRRYYADIDAARERGRKQAKASRTKRPDAYRVISQRGNKKRDSLKRGASIAGRVNFERINRRDRMVCHLCRLKVAEADLEFDHVIPLAKGGDHTEANIAVSHARCNRSKGAKRLTLF